MSQHFGSRMRPCLVVLSLSVLLTTALAQDWDGDADDAGADLLCFSCAYTNNGTSLQSRGSRDCMRPDDPEVSVRETYCSSSSDVCKTSVKMTFQYVHIIRECSSPRLCVNSTVEQDSRWTNITDCCTRDNCNRREVEWVDVDQHPDNHITHRACTSNRPAVLTGTNGTILSPVQTNSWGDRDWYSTGGWYGPTGYYYEGDDMYWGPTGSTGWDPGSSEELEYDPHGDYPNHANCEWRITVQEGYRITLTFNFFNLEYGGRECPYDRLTIYDGPDATGRAMHRFCGSRTIPEHTVISSSNNLLLQFTTDESVVGPGFSIRYLAIHSTHTAVTMAERACADGAPPTLTANTGSFHSPIDRTRFDTRDSYDNDRTTPPPAPEGTTVSYRTCYYNPCENGATCRLDYDWDITCHCPDGFTGYYCETPVVVNSCSNALCQNGGTCVDIEGYISCSCSIGYYGRYCEYMNSEICLQPRVSGMCQAYMPRWYYDSNTGYCESFIYGGCGGNDNRFLTRDDCMQECMQATTHDRCESGPCMNGASCQNTNTTYVCHCPAYFIGQRCETLVTFESCGNMTCHNGGTCMDYFGEAHCECPSGTSGYYCEIELDVCDSSPCFNGGSCMSRYGYYHCICPSGFSGIQCEFNGNGGSGCASVVCLNGGTCHQLSYYGDTETIYCSCPFGYYGNYCEYGSSSYTTPDYWDSGDWYGTGGDSWYDGDGSWYNSGYDYGYFGNDLYSYPNNARCHWRITVASDMKVYLQFHNFDLEYSTTCLYDKVDILSPTGQVIAGPYCGTRSGGMEVQTEYSNITVRFTTDGSVTGQGFAVMYRAVPARVLTTPRPAQNNEVACSANRPALLEGRQGDIMSPNSTSGYNRGNYPNSQNCEWRITAPEGMVITLDFYSFNLERCGPLCSCDRVVIYDGPNTTSDELSSRLCGTMIPSSHTSSGNTVLVKFTTDGSVTRSGFHIGYFTRPYRSTTPPSVPPTGTPYLRTTSPPSVSFTCYACTVHFNGDIPYGDSSCISPQQSSAYAVPLQRCHGACMEVISIGTYSRSVTRSCSPFRCQGLTETYRTYNRTTQQNVNSTCCNGYLCNSTPLLTDIDDLSPTPSPPTPPTPRTRPTRPHPANYTRPSRPTTPTPYTRPTPHRCFQCTYSSAGKVVLGRSCLYPDQGLVTMEECTGQCFVKRRVHLDPVVVTVIRGCETPTDRCNAANWGRSDATYEEQCCSTDLCNTDVAPEYSTNTTPEPENDMTTVEAAAHRPAAVSVSVVAVVAAVVGAVVQLL